MIRHIKPIASHVPSAVNNGIDTRNRRYTYLTPTQVKVRLTNTFTTPYQLWTRNGQCYVAVTNPKGDWWVDGRRADICSINGQGEVRWKVRAWDKDDRDLQAVRHFDGKEA